MDNDYIDVLRNEARMRQQTSPGVDSVDPMVQFAEEERARQRQLYKATTVPALSTNPDVYAKQKQDAAVLNVPTAVVQTLPQDSARQVQLKALDDNTAKAPVLRQKYTNADFAKLAHDDSQSLSIIERSLNYIFSKGDSGLVNEVGASTYSLSSGFAGAWRAGSENFANLIDANSNLGLSLLPESMASRIKKVNDANSPLRDSLRAFGNYWKNEAELAKATAERISPPDQSIGGGGVQSGVQSFVQNMLIVPTAFIPIVGPYASLSLLATSAGGTAYNEARKEGLEPGAALGYGLRQGGLEAAFEIAPILKLVKDVKIGTSLSRMFLNNLALEIPGEVSTTLLQNLDTYATLHPDRSFESFLREQPAAVAQTVIATIIGSGGNVAVGKLMESVVTDLQSHEQKTQQSTRTKQFIETITAATEESKLRARDLETFQSFVSATTDGTPAQDIYISAQTLMQSGVAEEVAKVLPSVAEQLNDAVQSNGFIRIPTAEYVANISGTELNQQLIDNIQLDPNGYTFKESEQYAKTFNQEMNAQLEKILIETKNDEVFNESKGKVRDQFLNELNATGRFTTETNAAYADLLASFYAVQAAKLGITTEELVQRYQLKTQAESVTGPALDQNGSRAASGGQIATANGYFYKGGQFLPSTENPPGKFKVGKKWVAAKSFLIEPGKNETQPTATALSIFSGIREYTTQDDNGNLILKEGIRDGQGGEVKPDAPYLEREGYPVMTYGDVVNAYNNGQRWVDVQAVEPVVNDNTLNQSANPVPTSIDAVSSARAAFDFAATKTFATNRDFKLELQDRVLNAAKNARVDLAEQSDRIVDYLVRVGLADAMLGLENNANAVGWYNEKVSKALRIISLVHPEIATDPQAKFAFVWALAVTSNGMKVDKNFELAEYAYETYKATGKMPTNLDAGQAQEAINDSLGLFNELMDKWGFEKLEKFMTTMDEVRNVEAASDITITGEGKGTQVFGAAILGPKIGNGFFANLYGYFDQLTMDRWLMRTWGRWTGTLINVNKEAVKLKQEQLKGLIELMDPDSKKEFEKIIGSKLSTAKINDTALAIATASQDPKIRAQMNDVLPLDMLLFPDAIDDLLGPAKKDQFRTTLGAELRKMGNGLTKGLDGQKEAPAGAKEREYIRTVFRNVLSKLQTNYPQLTMSDLQAVVWYPEKKLYDTAKSSDQESDEAYNDDEAPDYANAAAKLARKKGIDQAAIDQAQQEVDNEIQAQAEKRQADELAAGARRANAGEEGSTGVSGQTQSTTGTGSPGQTGVLNQSSELNQQARGAISFGDDITRVPSIIALLKNADLSTFLHESGHFFLQVQADLASRIEGMSKGLGASDAEMSIVNDMNIVLDWLGIKATPEQSAISIWTSMPLEEQRQYHETFARGFEAYAFEGNAPTLELQSVFQKFRSWLLNIYKELKNLNVELSDEVRGVFDRMLATTEQIKAAESARAMGPLFTPENSAGLIADFKAYHDLGVAATQQAIDELQVRGLADMKWLGNARSKVLKELQATAKGLRNEAVMDARREIMSQPIYRAWQFLTSKISADDKLKTTEPRKSMPGMVDPQIDSLFVAMAKLGGLRRDEVSSQWGLDEKIPFPLFGKPVVRADGGLSLDEMGAALAEDGYLTKDEDGRHDLTEFEERFQEELSGRTQYSSFVDPTIFTDELPGSSLNLEGLASGRLSAAVVNSMGLDDAVVARLTDLKMIAKEGIAPDLVAELFGLTSGDELVRTIAASPKPADAISLLADKYMLERHGELATPEAIQRAADAAIHNDMRLKALYTEAKALETALNVREDTGRTNSKGSKITAPLIPKAAREFAARLIARTRIRDLKPSQYTAAEVRAAKAAQDAFIKNDVAKAAEEKRNQIINATAAKEAMAAQVEVLKAVAYFKRFDKRSKTLDPEYYDQIAQMLERFSFVPSASLKSIDKQTSLATWIESQRDAGIEPNIPPSLENELYRQNYKNMTVEEIRGLRDTIEQIEHLGRLKNKLLTAKDAREFAAIRNDIVASITNYAGDRQANNRTSNTLSGQALDSVKKFWAAHIKAATWARIMDGGFDGGFLWEYIIRPANVAGDQEIQMRKEATQALTELIKPVLAQGKLGGKGQFFPSIDRSLNHEAVLAVALNMGNEGNQQRLLDGEGWTLSQIKPVLDTLTAADWQFVQSVWDHFESYRPLIAAKEKRVMGKEPTWIEVRALQVQTRDGQNLNLRGGYYPIKYDPMASERAETQLEAEEAKKQLQSAYTSATTRRSFTKTRADAVKNRPLLYSLDGIYQGVNEVIHDLAWHEWLIDTNRLIKDSKIAEVMREKYGAQVHQQFKSWLKDTAEGDRGAANAAEKSLGWIRQGVSVAGLGFNVMSALTQPFGITQSVVRVGAPWIARGLQKFMAHPIETAGEIAAMSSFMENRFLTRMRELAELRSVVKGQSELRRNIDAGAYALMLRAQQLVDIPTWWGAYEKAIASGSDQERSVALADQAVIDAQGSGTGKDLAAIERGGPALKLFTTFYSFFNAALNVGVEKTMTRKARDVSRAELAADYLLLYTVPVILVKAMKDALTPGDSGDWDWEDPLSILGHLIKENISFMTNLLFGVREFGGLVNAATGKPGGDYGGPSGLRTIGDTYKLVKELGQGEMDDGLRKAIVNLAASLGRLPGAQMNRSITGAEALYEGDTDNPAALIFGYQKEK